MGYTKPLVKAAGTALQTGAEKVLRSLPVEQADFIAKTFNFKPGSPQDTFVRMGGIHPTDGPGIINSIQRGEAQDLPQHITNAVGGEPAALNEIGRFSDNGTNQVTEDTIKANGLQQANAKYESQVEPKAYNLSEDVEDFMGDADVNAGREWYKPGGGQDQEVQRLLTVGRGKNAKVQTLEYLQAILNDPKASKSQKKVATDKIKRVKSMYATGPATDASDKIVYGEGINEPAITQQFAGEEGYVPAFHKSTEFHHKSMSELEGEIGDKARQLLREGNATEDDLMNLFQMGKSRGLESGSRAGAGLNMHRMPHQGLHQNIALPQGIQPSASKWRKGGKLKSKPKEISKQIWDEGKIAAKELGVELTRYDLEYIKAWSDVAEGTQGPINLQRGIAKWKAFRKSKSYDRFGPDNESEISRMVNEIKKINNIQDLMKYKKMVLDEIAEPMTKEAELLERVAREEISGRELLETYDPQTIIKVKDQMVAKETRKSEDLADKALRKQMNTAFN